MKKIAIIQARMGSTRFPGKVLALLQGRPVLQWVIERASKISTLDQIIVATSDLACDDPIVDLCNKLQISCFRGSETDVLARFYYTAVEFNADIIVRITADCPMLDPAIVEQALYLVVAGQADYSSNVLPPTWPDGLDCEVFSMRTLETAFKQAIKPSDREHVTAYIQNNQHIFKVRNISSSFSGLHEHRWTIDSKEDLAFLEHVLSQVKGEPNTWSILETLFSHPEIKQSPAQRNEGSLKLLAPEPVPYENFAKSNALLKRSLKTIPLGAQTFSKSYIQYPEHNAPLFLTHGLGGHVWDVDGNEFIDLVSGLLPIVLGYNDPDVNQAIEKQLTKGISFSLSTELEVQLSERLCHIIPSAEKVRFAKNGTDVTSAAIRLSRAYTGRDKVIVCGYHGWQDWYIGSTSRNKGVPKAVSDLTVAVPYNDLEQVEVLLKTEAIACMIMEPCNITEPHKDYLSQLKALCEQYGTLLVFDEIITGFRYALGGAQDFFGVTPHLSCFGKGMGNGMPISAIVGQDAVMKEMEEIFFSGTFGGETLSLAAALATIEKIEQKKVISSIWSYGDELSNSMSGLISKHGLSNLIQLCGYAPWKILQFSNHAHATSRDLSTLFIQEMIGKGILINSSCNINYAHNEQDKTRILAAFDHAVGLIATGLESGNLNTCLKCPSIRPLFKVR